MARVFSMHEVELRPGAAANEFAGFVHEAIPILSLPPGMSISLLKGDRGVRAGKYLLLVEFDGVETRARLWPRPDEPSAEMQQALASAAFQQFLGRWSTLATTIPGQGSVYTDYVVVAPEA